MERGTLSQCGSRRSAAQVRLYSLQELSNIRWPTSQELCSGTAQQSCRFAAVNYQEWRSGAIPH
eukprot:4409774-Pyramimonas_sp.AAC.1